MAKRYRAGGVLAVMLGAAGLALCAGPIPAAGENFHLAATPQTVAWGYYNAAASPALTIASGDRVTFDTLLTSSPTALEKAGVPTDQIESALREVYQQVTDKGPGGHILTGPVYVADAEPGDMLEIQIEKIELAIPYAYNGFRYGLGLLTDDFPYARMKIIPLDREHMLAHFAAGIDIPLHPFFGSMGVAPPPDFGRYDSTPPSIHGGNMDNKELVAGSTLFLPVHAKGALFEIGDGHAGQGNGEVDVTAMETSLRGTLRFILHKGSKIAYPRAETPSHYISMGFDDDLSIAAHKAVSEMVDFLVKNRNMSRDDAYMLVSVAGDVDITELVDRNKGVHVMLPKAIFLGGAAKIR